MADFAHAFNISKDRSNIDRSQGPPKKVLQFDDKTSQEATQPSVSDGPVPFGTRPDVLFSNMASSDKSPKKGAYVDSLRSDDQASKVAETILQLAGLSRKE